MKLHYITISAILLSVTSCADFDKINIDPENSIYVGAGDTGNDSNDDERSTSIDFPETIPDDELAFAKENEASVESDFKTFSYEGMYNDYQKTTNLTHDIYAGYFANNHPSFVNESPNYRYTDRYSSTRWEHFYRDRCKEYSRLTRVFKYVNPEKYKNAFYITRIYFAFLGVQMVDTYGNIPFSDYVRGQNPREKARYDTGAEVYDMCFRILAEAVENINPDDASQFTFSGNNDNCYHGDASKWVRFANTLRLRMALRISNYDPDWARREGTAALTAKGGLIQNNEDNMRTIPKHAPTDLEGDGIGGNENVHAMCSYIYLDVVMSKDMELAYKTQSSRDDPRMQVCWYRPTPTTQLKDQDTEDTSSEFTGCAIGSSDIDRSSAKYSVIRSYSRNSTTLDNSRWFGYARESVWLSYAETKFLLAEAALRNWGTEKDAETYFKEGIQASCDYYGILSRLTTAYVNGVMSNLDEGVFTNNKEKALEAIITQKWLAVFPNGNEGWAEFRRTDYPRLQNHIGNISEDVPVGKFIKRIRYPNSEYTSNQENIPQNYIDRQDTKIFWDIADTNNDSGIRQTPDNFR